jgi:hypothetical protein
MSGEHLGMRIMDAFDEGQNTNDESHTVEATCQNTNSNLSKNAQAFQCSTYTTQSSREAS